MTQSGELKSLVEAGHYKPEPAQVAEAMLQHRGVRDLLIGQRPASPLPSPSLEPQALSSTGQTQPPSSFPRQAA